MGAAYSAITFYRFGRKHFTKTGWKNAQLKYDVNGPTGLDLTKTDLTNKVYAVTGMINVLKCEVLNFASSFFVVSLRYTYVLSELLLLVVRNYEIKNISKFALLTE